MNFMKKAYEARKAAKQAKKDAEKAQFKSRNSAQKTADLQEKTRKPDEIMADFRKVCATAGNLQYKIEVDKQTLEVYNRRLFELQNENAESQKVWPEEKPKPEAPPVVLPKPPLQEGFDKIADELKKDLDATEPAELKPQEEANEVSQEA